MILFRCHETTVDTKRELYQYLTQAEAITKQDLSTKEYNIMVDESDRYNIRGGVDFDDDTMERWTVDQLASAIGNLCREEIEERNRTCMGGIRSSLGDVARVLLRTGEVDKGPREPN